MSPGALLPGDRIENISIERVMTTEVLAEDELERAQAMLDALNAPAEETRPRKAKKKAKKRQRKQRRKQRRRKKNVDDAPDPQSRWGALRVLRTHQSMPDDVEDREEEPTLNEGEKVDVIDPNEGE